VTVPITDADLAELARLEAAATRGPWEACDADTDGMELWGHSGACHIVDIRDDHDAPFIAAMRNALPGLLARAEADRARIAVLEAERDQLRAERDAARAPGLTADEYAEHSAEAHEAAQDAYARGRTDASAPETVICAAIRLPDGRIFRGHRHSDCIHVARYTVNWNGGVKPRDDRWDASMCEDQGFITSRNRYVDRKEGMRLQLAAGIESVAPGGYRGETLFSEDLY
jgi:hypothetical protein